MSQFKKRGSKSGRPRSQPEEKHSLPGHWASESGPARPTLAVAGTLTEYLQAALAQSQVERLADEPGYFGEIPGLPGVWAKGLTEQACRTELQSALEDWILFGLANHFPVPPIDGIEVRADHVV